MKIRAALIPVELRNTGEGVAVKIDLKRPMQEIQKELTKYPVSTDLSLNGTIMWSCIAFMLS